jgi:WD40 repeat protein
MAPEQAGGHSREVGPAADVYALGAILYEVLTGRPPFQGETTLDVLLQVRTQEPVPPGQLRARLPRDLETICLKCLEKSPARRYATARDLADDLRRFLDGRPIQARPVGPGEKLWRWCRRNPVVAGLWLAVALLLLAGTGFSTAFWLQADERSREAEARRIDADKATAQAEASAKTAKSKEEEAKTNARRAFRKAYTSDLRQIDPAWEDRQVGLVRELLDKQRPEQTGGEDLRGFEWYYWNRLCRSDLLTLTGHKAPVTCVTFSPDGRLLAAGARPGEVKLWDPATGEALLSLPVAADALAFSPDSRRLATAGSKGAPNNPPEVNLWDVQTGKLLQTFTGHRKPIRTLAYSPDGTLLAGGDGYPGVPQGTKEQGELKVWNTSTGREVFSLAGHTGPVAGVAFSPDGTLLASASEQEVIVWDPGTGKEERTLRSKEGRGVVAGLAFTPDGQRLARAGWVLGAVDFWDPRTGDRPFFLQTQRLNPIPISMPGAAPVPVPRPQPRLTLAGVSLSPDGQRLALALGNLGNPTQGGEIEMWDLQTKKYLLTIRGHASAVTCVAFSPDGKRLASGSSDQTVKVWDARAGEMPRTLAFTDIARGYLSPGGSRLARVAQDGTVKLWDVDTGQEAGTRQVRGPDRGIPPTFSPDGKYLAAVDAGGVAKVWDLSMSTKDRQAGGQEERSLQLPGAGVQHVALDPGGRRLAVGGEFPVPLVWDLSTAREVFRIRAQGPAGFVQRVVFSPDGKTLAGTWVMVGAGTIRNAVKVWDAESGQETHHLEGHTNSIWALAFSPDGRYLASASLDHQVKVWDLITKEVQTLKGHSDMVDSVAWSPDGRRLASGAEDSLVKVWDVSMSTEGRQAGGEELLTLRQGNWRQVNSVAFSPDGRRLISADQSNVKVWSALTDPNGTPAK